MYTMDAFWVQGALATVFGCHRGRMAGSHTIRQTIYSPSAFSNIRPVRNVFLTPSSTSAPLCISPLGWNINTLPIRRIVSISCFLSSKWNLVPLPLKWPSFSSPITPAFPTPFSYRCNVNNDALSLPGTRNSHPNAVGSTVQAHTLEIESAR